MVNSLLKRFWEACTAQNVFTFVIALATVGIYCVAVNQWRVTSRQTTDSEQVQRASVYADGVAAVVVNTDPTTGALADFNMFVLWKNSGTTPTAKAFAWINHVNPEAEIPKDFAYPNYDESGTVVAHACKATTFHPTGGGNAILSIPFKVSMDTMLQVHNHQQHFYIYGWAKYEDVFAARSDPARISRFCYEMADANIATKSDHHS